MSDEPTRRRFVTTLDEVRKVLYVREFDAYPFTSREAPRDGGLILSYDRAGAIIGVQLIDPEALRGKPWQQHPDRELLPADLLALLDEELKDSG